ncbi:MAG: hypothetical protein M0R48_11565 [Candidatus Omnitrophica bacterium]|nr:hypothetical protein [Candidatus Omnitrophota bacterium]
MENGKGLTTEARWVAEMHYNSLMKMNYEKMVVEAMLLQCLLKDLECLKEFPASAFNASERTQLHLKMREVRGKVDSIYNHIDKMADSTKLFMARHFGCVPTPRYDRMSDIVKKKLESK